MTLPRFAPWHTRGVRRATSRDVVALTVAALMPLLLCGCEKKQVIGLMFFVLVAWSVVADAIALVGLTIAVGSEAPPGRVQLVLSLLLLAALLAVGTDTTIARARTRDHAPSSWWGCSSRWPSWWPLAYAPTSSSTRPKPRAG